MLTHLQEMSRLQYCRLEHLCFVSLKDLFCGLPVVQVWHAGLGLPVKVLQMYVHDAVASEVPA
jgi:hypothetical protein